MENRTVTDNSLSVRASDINDFEKVIDYFLKSDKEFLTNMGVDISKLPSREEWLHILTADLSRDPEKQVFFLCYLAIGQQSYRSFQY